MLRDIRFAFRTLRQSPGFAITTIILIALAVGANSSIFSMADGLLLRPMPVVDASRVVSIRSRTSSQNFSNVSYLDFTDFREKSSSFEGLFAYNLVPAAFAKDARAQSQLKVGYLVSGNTFDVLGIAPRLGRTFRAEEDQVPGRDAVAVLSYDLWTSEFGGDSSVVGRRVRFNGHDFTVLGVLPESFPGIDHLFRPAFYIPAAMGPSFSVSNQDLLTDRSRRDFFVKGRLKSSTSLQAADSEIATIARSLESLNPSTNRAVGASVRTESQFRLELDPFEDEIIERFFGLTIIVLAIACANVANLMLNRGRARAREVAVRLAIGANRRRIVSQLMTESLVLALAGGSLGIFIAQGLVGTFSSYEVPGELPIIFAFHIDYRVVVFTLVASVLSAILFGLVPALQSTRTDLVSNLKAGELDQVRKRLVGRRALVVVQVAGSLVLLVAAVQMYRVISTRLWRSHGFRIDHRISMKFDPSLAGYTAERTEQFYRLLLDRTRSLSDVKSAALSSSVPMTSGRSAETVVPEGYEFPAGHESERVLTDYVGDHYFETLGVPMLAGRTFSATDRADTPPVAIVNEEFARRFFKGDAIGKRLRLDREDPWVEIVGMTVTGHYFTPFEGPIPWLFLPFAQHRQGRMSLVVETAGDPAGMSAPLREIVRSIDPNVPIFAVRTMEDLFDQRAVKIAHFFTGTVAALAVVGLVLAVVGLYAVVAYQTGRRTREIGIRMALGAPRSRVMSMILHHSAITVGIGLVIGTVICAAGNQILGSGPGLGADVLPLHPVWFIASIIALAGATLLAAAIPARNASRIDPQKALRQE